MKLYSEYQIKRALNDTVVKLSDNVYSVNGKHEVIDNKKNFRCDCKWFDDNKGHTRYCHCCLAVLRKIDKDRFWKEVSREK